MKLVIKSINEALRLLEKAERAASLGFAGERDMNITAAVKKITVAVKVLSENHG